MEVLKPNKIPTYKTHSRTKRNNVLRRTRAKRNKVRTYIEYGRTNVTRMEQNTNVKEYGCTKRIS